VEKLLGRGTKGTSSWSLIEINYFAGYDKRPDTFRTRLVCRKGLRGGANRANHKSQTNKTHPPHVRRYTSNYHHILNNRNNLLAPTILHINTMFRERSLQYK